MMSLRDKKAVLADYFRKNGLPSGCITVDDDLGTIGNVSIDGTFYGVFDYVKGDFITKEEF